MNRSLAILISLILVFPIEVITFSNSVFAAPVTWSEVKRFTGSGTESYTTDHFNCNHVEWRIRWEFSTDCPNLAKFIVDTYQQGEDATSIDSVAIIAQEVFAGTSYIHDNAGTFYMKIDVVLLTGYTIIIEEDLQSIPEFSSILVLPISMIASLLADSFFRKIRVRQSNRLSVS